MENFKLKEVNDKIVEKKSTYISLIKTVFKVDDDMASNIFESELENFKERAKTYYLQEVNNPKVSNPTMSLLQGTNIFLEVIHLGLSFSKSSDLIYLSRLKGTGTSIGYQATVKGEIFLAVNSGSISHVSEPVIVKNKENFKLKTNDQGSLIAHHDVDLENQSFNYEADFKIGYCYITYPNGVREISYTDKIKMDKSRDLSPSKGMYDDITFFQSKVIRRALHHIRKSPLHNQMEVIEDVFNEDANIKDKVDLNFETQEVLHVETEDVVYEAQDDSENMFNF